MTDVAPDSIKFSIPKSVFRRIVKDEANEYTLAGNAVELLQKVAEETVVTHFERANLVATHAHRITISPNDMQYASEIYSSLLNPTNENGDTAIDALFNDDIDTDDETDETDETETDDEPIGFDLIWFNLIFNNNIVLNGSSHYFLL